jgi:hypothetical protein
LLILLEIMQQPTQVVVVVVAETDILADKEARAVQV